MLLILEILVLYIYMKVLLIKYQEIINLNIKVREQEYKDLVGNYIGLKYRHLKKDNKSMDQLEFGLED